MDENESQTGGQESPATNETQTAQNSDTTADKSGAGTVDAGGGETEAQSPEAKGALQQLRETLAGGDEGLLKALERYKSTDAISKAFKEARTAAKSAGKPVKLGENATPEEIKAYREAMGIPETPDAYPVQFRQDYPADEADTAILSEFRSYMHGKNVDPGAAQAALEWYQDFAQVQRQELDGNLANVAKKTQQELRTEWGGEYDGNISAVQELMKTHLGDEGFGQMMDMRMMDGSRLQDHPGFVKMMAQIAGDYYGSNAIFNGDIETTSQTVQEQIDGLLELRNSDPEKYKSDAVQAKITKLYQQRDKISARK